MNETAIVERIGYTKLNRNTVAPRVGHKIEPVVAYRLVVSPQPMKHPGDLVTALKAYLVSFNGKNTVFGERLKDFVQVPTIDAAKVSVNQVFRSESLL